MNEGRRRQKSVFKFKQKKESPAKRLCLDLDKNRKNTF